MAILEGTAYWASITTPNTTFDPVYTVNLVVDDETANDLTKRLVNSIRSKDPRKFKRGINSVKAKTK